jgi:K+-transporting ATPase ATPase A chain
MFPLIVTLLVKPVGIYLARVFSGERTWLDPVLRPPERAIYRLAGVDPAAEMDWKRYATCFLLFGFGGTLLLYALVGVFAAGLMVGRTPEYLGKQLTVAEMKLIALYAVIAPLVVLPLTALAVGTDAGLAGLTTNQGPHGLSEILVAYTTSMANNGQNFAGLSANTPFYNVSTALAMVAGRFGLGIPALALAGLFAQHGRKLPSDGTLPTDTLLFAGLIIAIVLAVGALSYLPVLALGPIVEHLALR